MKRPITCGIACVLVLLLGLKCSFGQTDSTKSGDKDNLSLKDLLNVKVTTASKTSQELEMAPATVIVVTKEQIKLRGYQSLLDVIYDLPDMKVDDKINSTEGNTFTMRGTEGQEKFMIMLDGIPINSPSGKAMPIMENYPINLAEQIEIVYGPASALYGANAVSGVINIITKKTASRKGFNIDASSTAGTYGSTNSTLFIAKKIGEQANLIVSGQYFYDPGVNYSKLYKDDSLVGISSYKTGTLNTIYGPMSPQTPIVAQYQAPVQAYNIYAALHVDNFTFTFFRNDFTLPSSFSSNTSNAIYNSNVFIRQSTDMANAAYRKSFGKITSTTSLTVTDYNLDPQSNFRNVYTNLEPAYIYSTSSMMKGEEQLDYKPLKKLDFTGGVSYESYYSIPQSAYLDDPVNPNQSIQSSYDGTDAYYRPNGLPAQFYIIRYNNIGSYVQMQYSPVHKLNFTLGARYDINSMYGSTFNPRAGVVYKPFMKTTIKAMYGSAFIAPSPSDSYEQYGSFITKDSGKTYHSSFLHLPNPGLKPITSHNVELSIRQYVTDNFSLTLDGYYTELTGLHTLANDNASTHLYNNSFDGVPVDYIEVTINKGRQVNYGGSLQLNWKWSAGRVHANSYASLSYVNGSVDNDAADINNQLEFISPFIFHIGTDLKVGKFSFSPRLILMGRQNISGFADSTLSATKRQAIPGYVLLNVSLRYDINKKISIFSTVTNALNQRYLNVGDNIDLNMKPTETFYGVHEDPIRISGGINFNF